MIAGCRLRQPDEVDDPLTEVLRSGARQLLAQTVELEVGAFLAERADLNPPMVRRALSGTGTAPNGRCRPGSTPSRCLAPRSGIAGLARWRAHPVHLGDPAALGEG